MTSARTFLLVPYRSSLRWMLGAAAIIAAVAHIPVIAPHLDEAPYMGVLFIVLTAACFALGLAAVVRDSAAVYAAAATTCGLAVLGYAATRLVAFPMLADDVGNWLEPLGVVSVISELFVVTFSVLALVRHRSAATERREVTPGHRTAAPRPAPRALSS